jgi:hypothetical protein
MISETGREKKDSHKSQAKVTQQETTPAVTAKKKANPIEFFITHLCRLSLSFPLTHSFLPTRRLRFLSSYQTEIVCNIIKR